MRSSFLAIVLAILLGPSSTRHLNREYRLGTEKGTWPESLIVIRSPSYTLGIWSMIVSHLIEVAVILILRFLLSRENRDRDQIQSQRDGGLEGRDLNATAFSDMTDRENPK